MSKLYEDNNCERQFHTYSNQSKQAADRELLEQEIDRIKMHLDKHIGEKSQRHSLIGTILTCTLIKTVNLPLTKKMWMLSRQSLKFATGRALNRKIVLGVVLMAYIYFMAGIDETAYTGYRICARAFVLNQNGMIMLLHYSKNDFYQLPGGGRMPGENLRECVVREIEEETGYKVRILSSLFCAIEDYEDYRAVNYYFLCKVTSFDGIVSRTGYELESDIRIHWYSKETIMLFLREHIGRMNQDSIDYRMELKELCALEKGIRGDCI